MRLSFKTIPTDLGSALPVVIVGGGIMSIVIASTLTLGSFSLSNTHGRADWTAAFFHAENAVQWASQKIADVNPTSDSVFYSTASGTLDLDYMQNADSSDSGFRGAWVRVNRTNASLANEYVVTASARVNDKVRTISALVTKSPASRVFDYEYFLNNWGWWWGNAITGNGGNRANWDFDFRYDPMVNGLILANGKITENGIVVDPLDGSPPFRGIAGTDPLAYTHAGVPREPMPNLLDFTYYENKALAGSATNCLWVGTNKVVTAVHNNATKPGLYLEGTDSAPIIISNTVVVPGDVIIKGKITGRGTLYVGGNLYIAGDLTYKNGPNWSTPPETMNPAQRDAWVVSNKNKDLVGFAVRESILGGDVSSSNWKTYCYDAATYGLKNVGNEASLGADGILHTGDDNVPFTHADGSRSTWFDADGDGVKDSNFNYNTQLTMTTARANKIANYPTNTAGAKAYGDVASNNMSQLDGIFYTNHAAAMRLANANAIFHGVVVSRDEAIIFTSTLKFYYDSRVHSRYNNNPNVFVDLGLPIANLLSISQFAELPPDTSNL